VGRGSDQLLIIPHLNRIAIHEGHGMDIVDMLDTQDPREELIQDYNEFGNGFILTDWSGVHVDRLDHQFLGHPISVSKVYEILSTFA